MRLARRKSKRVSIYESDSTLTKTKIFRLIEQQVLKLSLVMGSPEAVEEIHHKMWTKGIEGFGMGQISAQEFI